HASKKSISGERAAQPSFSRPESDLSSRRGRPGRDSNPDLPLRNGGALSSWATRAPRDGRKQGGVTAMAENRLEVHVVTPEREVWTGEADMVVARAADGEVGILPGHAPYLAVLAP